MNRTAICVLAFMMFGIHQINAQSLKEITADKYYNLLAYSKAVDYYKELALEKQATEKNIRRAAECYKKLNDQENSSIFYEKLVNTNGATTDDFYNYSQVLKTLGNYSKSNEYMQRIQRSSNYSLYIQRHKTYKNYNIDLKKDSLKYTIKDAGVNSEENDFSLFINKNDVYFTSGRRNVSGINKKYSWDDTYFLDEYYGKFENGKISNINAMPHTIDSKFHEGPAIVSADGNTMYITRSNYFDKKLGKDTQKRINLKIFISKKDEKGNWSNLESFSFNNDEYSVGHPALSKDGKTMYFVSDMPGGYGQTDIYKTINENGVWSKPVNLGETINSEGKEMFPYMFNDGVLFYSSDGNAGLGGLDLYYAMPEQNNFFEPQNLGYPINTQYDDFGMYLNEDIKSGFLSSNRIGGKGKDDIYMFTSTDFIIPQFRIDGIVTDKYTHEPIINATVDLYDENEKLINTVKTDSKGAYNFNLFSGNFYHLEAFKDEYIKATFPFNTKNPDNKNQKADLKIESSGVYVLKGLVTDAHTKQPINNVSIFIKDKKNAQEVLKALTNDKGDFEKMLGDLKGGDLLEYEIQLQKEGYISKTIYFTQTLSKPCIFIINEMLDMSLTSASNGDITSLTINPIFFDLDKSDIRPDAQTELDKLAQILNTHQDIKVEINSSTDCRASNAYNMNLSKQRAFATANYLAQKGINKKRLKMKWTGENNLVTNCPCESTNENYCTEEQHQANRRSTFIVTEYKVDNKRNKIAQ